MNEQFHTYLDAVATEARANHAGVTPDAIVLETTDKAAAAV
jgi:hypothetical protein